jgi:hypothetical protein
MPLSRFSFIVAQPLSFTLARMGPQMAKIRYKENSDDWSMSDEREFIENLFNQRLNFYIVVYSLVITGTLVAKQDQDRVNVLLIGIFLCFVLGLSMYRACHKLLLILKLLHRTKQHPVRRSGRFARRYDWPLSVSINHVTGIWLPLATVLFLIAWLVNVLMR